ncbi:hypothetical protein C1645_806783 [Glomus cerebriforme]|uniref:Uncharacterized protein n=1 Tax=Glomus cerebriforme TaxID=658196 RepID=A0A397SR42_9GLOM|nr:hypothetical protein C1645_806783 [Glomus cerebriforme]
MYTPLGNILYSSSRYVPLMRKVLYRRAVKTDPVLAKTKLLLEFENVPLAVEEVEEFHDLKVESRHNLPTEITITFTKSKVSLFKEQLSSADIKLSESHLQTCAEKNNKQILLITSSYESTANESQFKISSEEPQLALKDTYLQLSSSSEEPKFVEMESDLAISSKESPVTEALLPPLPQETQQCLEDIKRNNFLKSYLSSIYHYTKITNMDIIIMVGIFQMLEGIILSLFF